MVRNHIGINMTPEQRAEQKITLMIGSQVVAITTLQEQLADAKAKIAELETKLDEGKKQNGA